MVDFLVRMFVMSFVSLGLVVLVIEIIFLMFVGWRVLVRYMFVMIENFIMCMLVCMVMIILGIVDMFMIFVLIL